ncbi:hypothetical protein [Aliivibrio fischeri]|uniref:hypothetical protein n=1 Tax=Aliivibrio fischeri TaxID=668 RepID=UPI0007C5B0BC|nr:hypothetical protein [Aliivibrio fischeri]
MNNLSLATNNSAAIKFNSITIDLKSTSAKTKDEYLDLLGMLDFGFLTFKADNGLTATIDSEGYSIDPINHTVNVVLEKSLSESSKFNPFLITRKELNDMNIELFATFDDNVSLDFHYGDIVLHVTDEDGDFDIAILNEVEQTANEVNVQNAPKKPISLHDALNKADSIEINDDFIRHFNTFPFSRDKNDVAVDADEYQLTFLELELAVYCETTNTFTIESDNSKYTVALYKVTEVDINQ